VFLGRKLDDERGGNLKEGKGLANAYYSFRLRDGKRTQSLSNMLGLLGTTERQKKSM
jgi:hypothetical protein